ncbi:hypothetical protein CLV75_4213 [Ruegeria conchae]|uniref:Uncharacterized protein n=1 Tax=Ruegeria conchae TaxID=981384 RepID=A0A497YWW3_9RHOB|nr:hypothetical protein CLV75_4213 [Ruegeria conchae]
MNAELSPRFLLTLPFDGTVFDLSDFCGQKSFNGADLSE